MPAASNNSAAPFTPWIWLRRIAACRSASESGRGAARRQRRGSALRLVAEFLEQVGGDDVASGSQLSVGGDAERRECGFELALPWLEFPRARVDRPASLARGATRATLGMKRLATGMAQFGGVDQLLARRTSPPVRAGRTCRIEPRHTTRTKTRAPPGARQSRASGRATAAPRRSLRPRARMSRAAPHGRGTDPGPGAASARASRSTLSTWPCSSAASPVEQFGDLALIDAAHAVGEHGVTRRRLALHGVRDGQHLVGRFQGRRGRRCQITHPEPRALARRPLTPCRAQHTPASFERVALRRSLPARYAPHLDPGQFASSDRAAIGPTSVRASAEYETCIADRREESVSGAGLGC